MPPRAHSRAAAAGLGCCCLPGSATLLARPTYRLGYLTSWDTFRALLSPRHHFPLGTPSCRGHHPARPAPSPPQARRRQLLNKPLHTALRAAAAAERRAQTLAAHSRMPSLSAGDTWPLKLAASPGWSWKPWSGWHFSPTWTNTQPFAVPAACATGDSAACASVHDPSCNGSLRLSGRGRLQHCGCVCRDGARAL